MIDQGLLMSHEGIFLGAIREGDIQVVEKMLKTKINPIILRYALSLAAEKGTEEIVKLLIEARVGYHEEAMSKAAYTGQMHIVKLFLGLGCKNCDPSLRVSSLADHLDILNLMIENGATDFEGAMNAAAQGNHLHIVQLLIDKGANDFDSVLTSKCVLTPDMISFLEICKQGKVKL